MTIQLVGECVNGKIVRDGYWTDPSGKRNFGITSPTPCKKCGGKGCPKPGTAPDDDTATS